jgi:tRNA G10  N-methylase Trm11
MKYIFILGRNIDLSIAELKAYFSKENNPISIKKLVKNSALVELKNPIETGVIEKLGGTIGIAEVLESENITKNLEKHELYLGESNKLNYCIWDFTGNEEINEIEDYLKQRFRKEKLKATRKRFPAVITLQDETKVPNISSSLIEEEYVVFQEDKSTHFARVIQKCNYEEIEYRDMNKPVRREELSISPRISKILINLSEVKEGETLVDPFCGIGVILSEALLQNINVIGIDRDAGAIKGAKENMNWFKFNKNFYTLKNNDSTKVEISKAEAIATEPDLGEILKKIPTENQARETLKRFEKLMINTINNLKGNISGKIVFTSPYIRTIKKRVGCNIERIQKETDYKLVDKFPIEEFKHNQVVGRQIFVLYPPK